MLHEHKPRDFEEALDQMADEVHLLRHILTEIVNAWETDTDPRMMANLIARAQYALNLTEPDQR